eukprot:TRINITY_DN8936_c0_g3_i1.p1 TRINITY_DN8936_c0_g3~~TRINITY_DN8936_c0_g3_i1.p1  ORF type:complete len:233 (-),score=8.85 TRINITY_DN8936_c0_g3_i1:721-1419(-)
MLFEHRPLIQDLVYAYRVLPQNRIRCLHQYVQRPESRKFLSECDPHCPTHLKELLVVEGQSAKQSMMLARSYSHQSVFAIQGRLPFPKHSRPVPQPIINLMMVLGFGLGDIASVHSSGKCRGQLSANYKSIRYGKIIFCMDADDTAKVITASLIKWMAHLCPDLFIKGMVYEVNVPQVLQNTMKVAAFGRSVSQFQKEELIQFYTESRTRQLSKIVWKSEDQENYKQFFSIV